eukprot:2904358-Pyramimonas_sp.AAC.1
MSSCASSGSPAMPQTSHSEASAEPAPGGSGLVRPGSIGSRLRPLPGRRIQGPMSRLAGWRSWRA